MAEKEAKEEFVEIDTKSWRDSELGRNDFKDNNSFEELKEINQEIDPHDTEKLDAKFTLDYTSGLVGVSDDKNTPAFTLRAVLIGASWAMILASLNIMGAFRDIPLIIPTSLASLISYPIGIFFANTLPNIKLWWGIPLNPGPFSVKEHVLIYVIANAAGGKPYGLNNVISQRLIFGDRNVHWFNSLLFVFSTQLLGYGISGLYRRFLVRPTAMLWPTALAQVAFFNAFHEKQELDEINDGYKTRFTRYQTFWIAFCAMFLYSWIPSYFATSLTLVAVVCLIPGLSRTARFLGSGSYSFGPGLFAFTFDWSQLTYGFQTVYLPWTTTLNFAFGGILFGWIIGPLWLNSRAFGTPELQSNMNWDGTKIPNLTSWINQTAPFDPIPVYNSAELFDANGYHIKIAQGEYPNLLDSHNNLNMTSYQMAGEKVYLTHSFALCYFTTFMSLGAIFSQVFLWYGHDVYCQFQDALYQKESEIYAIDEHAKIMKNYPDIKEKVYLIYFIVLVISTVLVCEFTPFYMPWWLTLLCIFIGLCLTLPVGIIQAITGYQPGLQIFTQVVSGLIAPGKTATVMAFKTMGYDMAMQALDLTMDLKLGHYMHISPLAMVTSQLIGATIGSFFSTSFAFVLMNAKPNADDWMSPWSFNLYRMFANAAGIWGTIGPLTFFGPNYPYMMINYGYPIGFVLPFIPWTLNKFFPHSYWRKINFVLIGSVMIAMPVGGLQIYLVTPILVGWFFQYYLFKRHRHFWNKFAWVIATGFDSAAPLTAFLAKMLSVMGLEFPVWALNPRKAPVDYYCFDMPVS